MELSIWDLDFIFLLKDWFLNVYNSFLMIPFKLYSPKSLIKVLNADVNLVKLIEG